MIEESMQVAVCVSGCCTFVTVELFHKDAGEENNDLSEDDLSEDLPVDEGVAEVIGGLLSKVHSAPSHKSEAVVHLGLVIA